SNLGSRAPEAPALPNSATGAFQSERLDLNQRLPASSAGGKNQTSIRPDTGAERLELSNGGFGDRCRSRWTTLLQFVHTVTGVRSRNLLTENQAAYPFRP